ncbi:hypothetical protein Bca4012_021199 [Brassica carinata]
MNLSLSALSQSQVFKHNLKIEQQLTTTRIKHVGGEYLHKVLVIHLGSSIQSQQWTHSHFKSALEVLTGGRCVCSSKLLKALTKA